MTITSAARMRALPEGYGYAPRLVEDSPLRGVLSESASTEMVSFQPF
jgi:hypothetical protein